MESLKMSIDPPSLVASSPDLSYFLRGCKWSPDGSCLLVVGADNVSRLYNLPEWMTQAYNTSADMSQVPMTSPALEVRESNLIYDFTWYPKMDSLDPSTCFYTVTSSCNPIRLVDAYSGSHVATYRAFDHLDQMKSGHCLCFSADGSKLFSGYENCFRIFQTSIPGTTCSTRFTHRKQSKGQNGILSAIALNPTDQSMVAIGSYSKQVALYDEREDGGPICCFEGQKGGVTHLMFTPDGNYLLSGGRKDPEILFWDIRNLKCLDSYIEREVETNQRIYFDMDAKGQSVVSGSTCGKVNIWNLKMDSQNDLLKLDDVLEEIDAGSKVEESGEKDLNPEQIIEPQCTFTASCDCVNGVSWHPSLPMIATVSGQRHFPELKSSSDGEESDDDGQFFVRSQKGENRIKLWMWPTSINCDSRESSLEVNSQNCDGLFTAHC